MLRNFIYRLTHRHHYWRTVAFDELAELYTSMTFRTLAQSIIGIFIPIYLYQLGHSVAGILIFYTAVYLFWQCISIPAGYLIARVGPKHTMLYSQVIFVIALGLLLLLASHTIPLVLIAFFLGVSNGMFFIAFHVDFSKVQHRAHGGKELGWLFTLSKLGVAAGPIVGGAVAYFFGAQYIFLAAIILLFFGTIPLFFTAEPTKTHQKISFEGLSLRKMKYDIYSYAAAGVENMISITIWPFFIGIYVLSDNPYIELGIVTSASVIMTLIAARSIGAVIDNKRGRKLLRAGVTLNAGLHLVRPFVTTFPIALIVNMVNELITPMYRMPLVKGMFDAASDLPGRRIAYLSLMEGTSTFARMLFFAAAAVLASIYDPKKALIMCFVIGSIASLLISVEKFRALRA